MVAYISIALCLIFVIFGEGHVLKRNSLDTDVLDLRDNLSHDENLPRDLGSAIEDIVSFPQRILGLINGGLDPSRNFDPIFGYPGSLDRPTFDNIPNVGKRSVSESDEIVKPNSINQVPAKINGDDKGISNGDGDDINKKIDAWMHDMDTQENVDETKVEGSLNNKETDVKKEAEQLKEGHSGDRDNAKGVIEFFEKEPEIFPSTLQTSHLWTPGNPQQYYHQIYRPVPRPLVSIIPEPLKKVYSTAFNLVTLPLYLLQRPLYYGHDQLIPGVSLNPQNYVPIPDSQGYNTAVGSIHNPPNIAGYGNRPNFLNGAFVNQVLSNVVPGFFNKPITSLFTQYPQATIYPYSGFYGAGDQTNYQQVPGFSHQSTSNTLKYSSDVQEINPQLQPGDTIKDEGSFDGVKEQTGPVTEIANDLNVKENTGGSEIKIEKEKSREEKTNTKKNKEK